MINGYAYTAGSAHRDYKLSLARAAAVAASSKTTDPRILAHRRGARPAASVTPRSAGTNGRVLVVIESRPAG